MMKRHRFLTSSKLEYTDVKKFSEIWTFKEVKMALFISGMKCCLCGEIMSDEQKVKMLPPFVLNKLDPLFLFHDSSIHVDCFNSHPLSEKVARLCHDIVLKHASKRCDICSSIINTHREYVGFSCLSSDELNPLSRYNATQYHKSCFADSGLEKIIRDMVCAQKEEGIWQD